MKTFFLLLALVLAFFAGFYQYNFIQLPLFSILDIKLPVFNSFIKFLPLFLIVITTMGIGAGLSTIIFGAKNQTTIVVSLLKFAFELFCFYFIYQNVLMEYIHFPSMSKFFICILFISFNLINMIIGFISFIFRQVD